MNITLFAIMLFSLQIFYWFVARRFFGSAKGKEDYFLAEKTVQFFPLMMTFLATMVGGGIILGASEEAYRFGWPVLLYPIGAALGLMFLGSGIGGKLARLNVSTIAQIFEVVYGSPLLKRGASLLSVISLFMILVAQVIASNKFLVSMGFNNTYLFILFWTIVMVYTARGGLRAVISTDMVQAAFFSTLFLLCFGMVLLFEPSVALIPMPQLESFNQVSSKLCGWLLMPLLFMVVEQDIGQRCFAGASPKVVSSASFWAGVGTIVVGIVPVFFGCLAHGMELDIPQESSVLMVVIAQLTNPWITALVGCAVLAAIISTATSLINAISSNISGDFKLPFLNSMRVIQGLTAFISMGAIFFAFYFSNILDVLVQTYELSVSCLFVPICMALFRKEGSFSAALWAVALGALGFFLFRVYPIAFPKEIATIVLSFLGFGIGQFFEKNKINQKEYL